jgi:hypothetical protein
MKTAKFKRASSEATVSRMVAQIFGVPGTDHWHEAAQRADESDAAQHVPWSMTEVRLYPWVEDVGQVLFKCGKKDELVIALVAAPGTVFLVNDSGISGRNGLWLVVADDAGNGDNNAGYAVASAPVMMLTNHAFFDDNTYTISAIQLTSCLRQSIAQ